jgi:acetylornithine deacetylase/succinyl-diaminopimelate desuccinylase family protein
VSNQAAPLDEKHGYSGHDTVDLAMSLIAAESYAARPRAEYGVAQILAEWLSDRGIQVDLQPTSDGSANVIATVEGGTGPSLMFNGHTDTVPPGGMKDAFSPRLEGGQLRGRGACDMKGAVAAMACALFQIKQSGIRLSGDLVFAATCDEETASLGAATLVENGPRSQYVIVGEPTSLRVAVAHKGTAFLRISLHGRAAHGSTPQGGVNAISQAANVVHRLEEYSLRVLGERTHPLLGVPTINVGRISGGSQPNIVPDECSIDIDRRFLPGEVSVVEEVRGLVETVCNEIEGLTWSVCELASTSRVPAAPLEARAESPLVQAALDVCLQLGLPSELVGVDFWTEGGVFSSHGMETIVFGPGSIRRAHGPEESVPVCEILTAREFYVGIAQALLVDSTQGSSKSDRSGGVSQ